MAEATDEPLVRKARTLLYICGNHAIVHDVLC